MKTSRRARGTSLVEILIASVILVGVVLIVMNVLHSSASTASKGSITSDLEDRGARLMGFCREEFLQARFTGSILPGATNFNLGIPSGSANTAVGYRMPGNLDASGVLVPGGNVVFGYTSPLPSPNAGFRQDLACFLRFEADTLYKESSATPLPAVSQPANWGLPFPDYPALETEILNRDMNRDGDQTDSFVKGKIYRYIVAPAGSPCAVAHTGNAILAREPMSDNVILRASGAGVYNLNMEGDAASPQSVLDPLFLFVDDVGPDGAPVTNANVAVDGRGIQVIVWHGSFDDMRKGFLLRKSSALLRFRNTQ